MVDSGTGTAAGTRARGGKSRRPLWQLLVVWGVALLIAEGGARLSDRWLDWREPLVHALGSIARSGEPAGQPFACADVHEPVWLREDAADLAIRQRAVSPADVPEGGVFVVGGSAAYGLGVPFAETFAARLDTALGSTGRRVYNAGYPGATSSHELAILCALLNGIRPESVVIFSGNNEWMYWAPTAARAMSPRAATVLHALAASYAVSALELAAVKLAFAGRGAGGEFREQAEMIGSGYALAHPADDTLAAAAEWIAAKQAGLDRFEANLERMVREAQQRGARAILLTAPFNYRLSPAWMLPQPESYAPAHRDRVRALLHEAAAARGEPGGYARALELLDAAAALDPLPPLIDYLRGECLERLGRFEAAEAAYARSREHTMGHLGARLSINERIRAVGARLGAPVVDVQQVFAGDTHARGRYFHDGLIADDCHPTPQGHALIAAAVRPALDSRVSTPPQTLERSLVAVTQRNAARTERHSPVCPSVKSADCCPRGTASDDG